MTGELEILEIETGPDPSISVIWLHGLGADAHDFEPAVPMLALGPDRPMRFMFPNAPMIPVTINGGAVMRAWYDITGFSPGDLQDAQGIRASAASIEALIRREQARGIESGRIIVAGFSQGGAIALFCALRFPDRLCAVIALSTYLVLEDELAGLASDANRELPIFMAHGDADLVVPLGLARASHDRLSALGYPVTWQTYPGGHGVCPEEIEDIRTFIASCG